MGIGQRREGKGEGEGGRRGRGWWGGEERHLKSTIVTAQRAPECEGSK